MRAAQKPYCYFYPRAPGGARPERAPIANIAYIISIRVPREGHDYDVPGAFAQKTISIRVPREGHDRSGDSTSLTHTLFLSACPGRGTTGQPRSRPVRKQISIRVPREGHDHRPHALAAVGEYFYPRAPGGARRRVGMCGEGMLFISIRVPREGHDGAGDAEGQGF